MATSELKIKNPPLLENKFPYFLKEHLQVMAEWVGLPESERTLHAQRRILRHYTDYGPVLFTDGVKFTPLSTTLNPLQLAYELHANRKTIAAHTEESGGTPAYPYWAADETRVRFPHPTDMSVNGILYQLLAAKRENSLRPLQMRMVVDIFERVILDDYILGPKVNGLTNVIENHAPEGRLYITSAFKNWLTDPKLTKNLVYTKKVGARRIYLVNDEGGNLARPTNHKATYPQPFSDEFATVLDHYDLNRNRHETIENRYTWNTPVIMIYVTSPKEQLLLDLLLQQSVADYFIRKSADSTGALVGKSDGSIVIATAPTSEAALKFAQAASQALQTQHLNSVIALGKGNLLISRIGRTPDGRIVDDVIGHIVNKLGKLCKNTRHGILVHPSIAQELGILPDAEELKFKHGTLTLQAYLLRQARLR